MRVRRNIRTIWEYINTTFEPQEVEEALSETVAGTQLDNQRMTREAIGRLSDEDAISLLFNLSYMVVNEFFDGDWETWQEVLK